VVALGAGAWDVSTGVVCLGAGVCTGACVRGCTGWVCTGACVGDGTCVRGGTVGATVVVEGDAEACAESSGAGNMAAAAATAPNFLTPQTTGLLVISISLRPIRQRTATRVDPL
jgi:hypothetical protein